MEHYLRVKNIKNKSKKFMIKDIWLNILWKNTHKRFMLEIIHMKNLILMITKIILENICLQQKFIDILKKIIKELKIMDILLI